MKMESARNNMFFIVSLLTLLPQTKVLCFTYKVGDLDSWGIPTSSNPDLYPKWSKHTNLKIGDSILFLYPPSQDSVIQVTSESYKSCNLKDPILYMNDGNSLFNITSNGVFYFTSAEAGHCQKKQNLRLVVGDGNGALPSDDAPTAALPEIAADAPSYPTVFGSIPVTASSTAPPLSSSSALSSHLHPFWIGHPSVSLVTFLFTRQIYDFVLKCESDRDWSDFLLFDPHFFSLTFTSFYY